LRKIFFELNCFYQFSSDQYFEHIFLIYFISEHAHWNKKIDPFASSEHIFVFTWEKKMDIFSDIFCGIAPRQKKVRTSLKESNPNHSSNGCMILRFRVDHRLK